MKMMIGLLIMLGMFLLVGTKLISGASWSSYVLEENETGINAVNVTAIDADTNAFVNSTLTNTNGFFNITITDNTKTKLISSKSGYLTDTSQTLPKINDSEVLPFNITLEQVLPGNLSGRITNAGGEGLENANVSALQNNLTIDSVLTNSSGHYILSDLRDGTYDLRITATGYLTQEFTNVVVLPGNTTITNISPPLEITSPVISNVGATLIISSEAVIIWQTNEDANSSVNYWKENQTTLNSYSSTLMSSHLIRLSSLSSSTLYYYTVSSCDFAGNCNSSQTYNFTTLAQGGNGIDGDGDGRAGGRGSGGCGLGYKIVNGSCVKIEEIPGQLFDIRLEVENSLMESFSEFVVIVTFESFGTEPTPVNLLFTILNETGEEVYSEDDYIVVETEEVLRKSFEGIDLKKGKYILILTTLYNIDVVDEFRQEFEIGEERGINLWVWIVGGIVVGGLIIWLIYWLIKNKIKRKRRSRR